MRDQWGPGDIEVISGKLEEQGMNLEKNHLHERNGETERLTDLTQGGMEDTGKQVTVI